MKKCHGVFSDPHPELGGPTWGWSVNQDALSLLAEVANGTRSPVTGLVAAMLADEAQALLPTRTSTRNTRAVVLHARNMIHELGNTLTPLQVTLNSIERAAKASGISSQVASHAQRAHAILERLHSFSAELGDLVHAAGEPPDVFETADAVHKAAQRGAPETGYKPTLALADGLPPLHGVRARFVAAVMNLLRNAYQAAPAQSPQVTLTATCIDSRVRIAIDDNGPGVPISEREHIFIDGYSTRSSSGHGLALARATIEDEMNGTLTCEDGSVHGGARFVITVPSYNRNGARA